MSYRKRSYGSRSYGSRDTQRGFSRPAPVEDGKEYEASITEMSRRGAGIAKIQGFIVFVSGAKTCDNVKFRVTRVGRRFAEAEVVQ